MNVLDRYFQIFSEGANDELYRKKAADTYRDLLEALRTLKLTDVVASKDKETIASVNVGELLENVELEDLLLHFVVRNEDAKVSGGRLRKGAFLPPNRIKQDESKIKLYFNVPEKVGAHSTSDPETWKKIVVKKAADILSGVRDTFFHEFIHYLDWDRMNKGTRHREFGKKLSKNAEYFNSPLETNAFIQQGLGSVEDHLRSVNDRHTAEKLIGKSPDEFYKLMLKVLSKGLVKHMNDKNKNKLKKRVANMWTNTMKKYGG